MFQWSFLRLDDRELIHEPNKSRFVVDQVFALVMQCDLYPLTFSVFCVHPSGDSRAKRVQLLFRIEVTAVKVKADECWMLGNYLMLIDHDRTSVLCRFFSSEKNG